MYIGSISPALFRERTKRGEPRKLSVAHFQHADHGQIHLPMAIDGHLAATKYGLRLGFYYGDLAYTLSDDTVTKTKMENLL